MGISLLQNQKWYQQSPYKKLQEVTILFGIEILFGLWNIRVIMNLVIKFRTL